MKMISKDTVFEKLKEIYEPCMPVINIVEMGLIYSVETENNNVSILMTFSTPNCPAKFKMVKMVEEKVKEIEGVGEVKIEMTFDPPWSKDMLSEENRKKLGFI